MTKKAAKKQWEKFKASEKVGVKSYEYNKVADAIGRKLTPNERKKLRDANYNPAKHTVSVKKVDGKLSFTLRLKKGRGRPPAMTPKRKR